MGYSFRPEIARADQERGARVNLDELIAEYEQQMNDGIQARLARFDRAKARLFRAISWFPDNSVRALPGQTR